MVVFMFEDLKVAAGQVIVSDAMALAQTDEDQVELAVRQHSQMVYRIAYSVLRNHHDAEDATRKRSFACSRRDGSCPQWMIHGNGWPGLRGESQWGGKENHPTFRWKRRGKSLPGCARLAYRRTMR
jgi:hypothetical protein